MITKNRKRNVQYQKIYFHYNKYIFHTSHKRSSINIYSKVQTTQKIYSHNIIGTVFIQTTTLIEHQFYLAICSPSNIQIQCVERFYTPQLMLKTNREVYVFIQYIHIFSIFKIRPISISIMYRYIFNIRLLFTKSRID